jgi:hypothetical protein
MSLEKENVRERKVRYQRIPIGQKQRCVRHFVVLLVLREKAMPNLSSPSSLVPMPVHLLICFRVFFNNTAERKEEKKKKGANTKEGVFPISGLQIEKPKEINICQRITMKKLI